MYVVHNRPQNTTGYTIEFYGTPLRFTPHDVAGHRKMAAALPPNAPEIRTIRSKISLRPDMELVKDATPWEPTLKEVAPKSTVAGTPVQQAMLMAVALGWSFADLAGSGEKGNPGEPGGRSPHTGMTLTEMALMAPPPDWSVKSDEAWPWQLDGFEATMPNWKHPQLSPKTLGAEVKDEPQPDGAPVVVDPNTPIEPPAEDKGAEDGDEKEDAPKLTEPVVTDTDPAVAAGYPAESVDQARAVLIELREKSSTDKIAVNRANYVLNAADLPKVSRATLDALLADKA